jgi:hypothetical protein
MTRSTAFWCGLNVGITCATGAAKLDGLVDWSWLRVFAPLWFPALLVVLALPVVVLLEARRR